MRSGGSFLWSALEACDTIFSLRGAGTWDWGIYTFLIRLFFLLSSFFISPPTREEGSSDCSVPTARFGSSLGNVACCRWHLIIFSYEALDVLFIMVLGIL